MAEKPARRGRKPRGAEPAVRLVVYVLPATKQALEHEAAAQAVSLGAVLDGWATSYLTASAVASTASSDCTVSSQRSTASRPAVDPDLLRHAATRSKTSATSGSR